MEKERRRIDPASTPSGDGCVECLASQQGWWFHLRRCATCGHIGCCDSSPSQHASMHAAATGHAIIASFEPSGDTATLVFNPGRRETTCRSPLLRLWKKMCGPPSL